VDHIEGEKDRDLQTGLFDGDALELIGPACPTHAEGRTQQTLSDQVWVLGPVLSIRQADQLLKLSELFRNCHFCEQRIQLRFDVGLRQSKGHTD
jgi:hypothetical protein